MLESYYILQVLDLEKMPPADILEEIVEEKIFELRDYFLRNPVVPVLYNSRLRRLKSLAEIQLELSSKNNPETLSLEFPSLDSSSLTALIKSYQSGLAVQRTFLAQTLNAQRIKQIVQEIISFQKQFEQHFAQLIKTEHPEIEPLEEQVKQADQLDTGVVLFKLKTKPEEALSLLRKEYSRILLIRS